MNQVVSVYGLSPKKRSGNLTGQLLLLKEGLEARRGMGRMGRKQPTEGACIERG